MKDLHLLNTDIFLKLFETMQQLDVCYKKAFGDILNTYTISEMHIVDFIGKSENPNVTKIASALNLTKAAVSKSIKKLINRKALELYKSPENKKEIYYKLTSVGVDVFNKHLKMHKNWCAKDIEFFNQFSKDDLEKTYNILLNYDKLLKKRLENIKENLK